MTATLMTVDQMRQHIETALEDDALQRIMDGCEEDINRWAGRLTMGYDYEEPDEVEEWHTLSRLESFIVTRQPVGELVSVATVASGTDLIDEDTDLLVDEEIWVTGNQIRRKDGYAFNNRVRVRYIPYDSRAQRRNTLIQLVKLEINVDPGTGFEGAGSWQHTSQDYEQQKQHILWALYRPPQFA